LFLDSSRLKQAHPKIKRKANEGNFIKETNSYLYAYSGRPDAETILVLFLNPSSQKGKPYLPDFMGDSGPNVESDRMVQESAPCVRIGMVAALLELLLPICERFR